MTHDPAIEQAFDAMWSALLPVGRTPATGGYCRFAWTSADALAREWFTSAARERGLDVQPDRNGNLWAWWLPPGDHREPVGAFATGSHLDSVPEGGAFDGPLGVVSALCAIDVLRSRGITPVKPVAVVVFTDEEGARFGVACVGSRLSAGALEPSRALALVDTDGVSLGDAMAKAGTDSSKLGRDDESLRRIGVFIELHVEQGRALAGLDAPVGVAEGIWPHGRWRFSITGKANHAGTTQLAQRHDPVLCFAEAVLTARNRAERHGGLATFGRVVVEPNATNGIASHVDCWLDARAPEQRLVDRMVRDIAASAEQSAAAERVELAVTNESFSSAVEFSSQVRRQLHASLGDVPELSTGAGHDAGVLAGVVPTGMLFVRNPTGISHAPEEFAERADCLAGVAALADVMAGWGC